MQPVSDHFGLAIKRLIAPAVLGMVVLASAAPALAADPAAYLEDMPKATEVMTTFTGSNPLDTAAQQYAGLLRLDDLMGALTAARNMTAAERELRNTYYNSPGWAGILASVKASLPEDQRDYLIGTQFTAWEALVDHYRADSTFNAKFRSLFPSSFRTAYASQLDQLEARGKTPSLPPPTTTAAAAKADQLFPLVVGGLFVAMAIFAVLLKRGRLDLDKQNPFRLYVGGRTYDLRHVTGVASGVSKVATTSVFGSGGGEDGAPVSVGSYSTVHDQFFVSTGGGHKESVQLAGWNFPVDNDHLVSAVSMGDKGYLYLSNHTTNDNDFNWNLVAPKLLPRRATTYQVIELALCAAIAYPASLLIGSYPWAIGAAVVGVVFGSAVWHYGLKGGYFSRFRKHGLPRLQRALDDEARVSAAAQG
jgi:hypothetical protein